MSLGWKILIMLGLSWFFYAGCADWQVKTPGEPMTSEEQPRPQGKTSIGGEQGGHGQ